MNFDVNMINNLMQMMSANKNTNFNANTNINTDTRPSYSHNSANENYKNVSTFASENGIGEKVDFERQDKGENSNNTSNILSMLKGIAPNNPLLQMLGVMGGNINANGNSNGANMDISQMLPLLMSIMGSKASNVKSNNVDNNINKNENNFDVGNDNIEINVGVDKDKNDNIDIQENAHIDDNCQYKTKTQQGLFNPVAFAGYEVLCTLCKLMLLCKSDS